MIEKFRSRDYRTSYMSGRVRTNIALQIRQLRETNNMSQSGLADLIGTRQSAISRLENTDYGRVSVQTLLDIASALDVAVAVKFVSYDEFISQHGNMTVDALSVESFSKTFERYVASAEGAKLSFGLQLKIAEAGGDNKTSFRMPDSAVQTGSAIHAADIDSVVAGGRHGSRRRAEPLTRQLVSTTEQQSKGIRVVYEGERAA